MGNIFYDNLGEVLDQEISIRIQIKRGYHIVYLNYYDDGINWKIYGIKY